MQRYPAVLCFYAAGVGCVGSGQYETLGALFTTPRATFQNQDEPFAASMFAWSVLEPYIIAERNIVLPGLEQSWCPFSDRLEKTLRPLLLDVLPANFPFTWYFDRFELMTALALDAFSDIGGLDIALLFRTSNGEGPPDVIHHIAAALRELKAQQERWPPFRMGFLSQMDANRTVIEKLTSFMQNWEQATKSSKAYWSGHPPQEFYRTMKKIDLHQ